MPGKGSDQAPAVVLADAGSHLDAGLLQVADTASVDARVGVGRPDENAPDAGPRHRLAARAGAPAMGAGLEGDVEIGARRLVAGVLESEDFGVRFAGAGMEALSDDLPVAHHHGAHRRVGLRAPLASPGQFQGLVHELFGFAHGNNKLNISPAPFRSLEIAGNTEGKPSILSGFLRALCVLW